MDGEFRNQSGLTEFQANLLNDFQRDFPLCPQPYKVLAEQLGVEEKIVLDHLQKLEEQRTFKLMPDTLRFSLSILVLVIKLKLPSDSMQDTPLRVQLELK